MSMQAQLEPNQVSGKSPTFADPELEQAFVSYCQLVGPVPSKPIDFERERQDLLGRIADYVHLSLFRDADADHAICGSTLLEALPPLEERQDLSRWPEALHALANLCACRVLSVTEERAIMMRMHYYKHLATQILSAESIDQWDLTRAQGLVRAALWHRDLIAQSNMRLVVSIIKKLPVPVCRRDELISEGTVGLLRAINKFDPTRGYRFSTYATMVVRRECYQYLQHCREERSLFLPASGVTMRAAAPAEGQAEADRSHWLAWRKRLPGLMSSLTRREQVIIRSRYCLGAHRRVKTLKRLAEALKISKERVRQLERSAMVKLRRAAEAQR